MKKFYLTFAVLGGVLPFIFFDQFFFEHGFALSEFVSQLFSTSPAAGFTTDLLITSFVFWVWSYGQARKYEMKNWWLYVVVNLLIGLSCALPLFVFFRQRQVELRHAGEAATEFGSAEFVTA